MWYHTGQWTLNGGLRWENRGHYDQGWNPKVSVAFGSLLEVHNAGRVPGSMWYHVGRQRNLYFDMGPSYWYDTGWNPVVALDPNSGAAVEAHNASNTAGSVWYHLGHFY
jgi:hypothetical protein